MKRNRLIYLCTAIITMVLGLFSRRFGNYLPEIINGYLGDALWALMIYQFTAILFPRRKTLQIALFSLAFCYLIEISQLYHAPWVDTVRNTRLGGLVLGFGFLWTDIIAYSFGIGFGALVEKIVYRRKHIS